MTEEEEKVKIRKGIKQVYYVPKSGFIICAIAYFPEIDKYRGVYVDEKNYVLQYENRKELEDNYNNMRTRIVPKSPTTHTPIDIIINRKIIDNSSTKAQFQELHVLQWINEVNKSVSCEIYKHSSKRQYQGSMRMDETIFNIENQYDLEKNWILMSEGCKPDMRTAYKQKTSTIRNLSKQELDERGIVIVMGKKETYF